MQCPWGEKALSDYLGPDRETWKAYDATELVRSGHRIGGTILIDQRTADNFLDKQLKPHLFADACKEADQAVDIRMREGYDHSYYLMATFMGDHINHHARALKG